MIKRLVVGLLSVCMLSSSLCYAEGACNHDYNRVGYKNSTCTKDGYSRFECSKCGLGYEITLGKYGGKHEYKRIKTVKATCKKDGYKKFECQRCYHTYKKPIKKLGGKHKYTVIKEVKATCESKGYKQYKCKRCGYKYKTYTKDLKGEHKYSIYEKVEPTYVKNGYLRRKCTKCTLDEKKVLRKYYKGYVGYLSSKSLGLGVRVYKGPEGKKNQYIVDRENSAYGFTYGEQYMIADHVHQGFYKIKNAVPGETTLKFKGITYKCSKKFNGKNTGESITYLNGNDIINSNKGGLTLYTCNDASGKNVTVTFWKKVKK